jgi:hypothetical protein
MDFTAIPAVKEAVLEILDDAEGLEGVTVAAGLEPTRADEYVWIWKAKAKRVCKSVGRNPPVYDEDVSLTMRALVVGGENPEARVFEIVAATETALRSSITLDGAVKWHKLEELDQEPLQFDQKLGCHILMTLTARARI